MAVGRDPAWHTLPKDTPGQSLVMLPCFFHTRGTEVLLKPSCPHCALNCPKGTVFCAERNKKRALPNSHTLKDKSHSKSRSCNLP